MRFQAFLSPLYRVEWVVYAKPPFAGPQTVLRYLGRYTHRIALSNERLVGLDSDDVLFSHKDRAADDGWKTMRLPALEFIRRFLLHVLPDHFVRIRYFGLLAHRHRRRLLALCRALLGFPAAAGETVSPPQQEGAPEAWHERLLRLTGFDALQCPTGRLDRPRLVGPWIAPYPSDSARAPP